jgi:predicted membrane protein
MVKTTKTDKETANEGNALLPIFTATTLFLHINLIFIILSLLMRVYYIICDMYAVTPLSKFKIQKLNR